MKKKSLLKRIAALAMSAAMALGMVSVANAATIDGTRTGTLQIQKYKTGTNVTSPEEGDAIVGVTFKYVKVGDFALTDGNVNGFTLETNLENLLTPTPIKDKDGNDVTVDNKKVYDGSAVQNALKAELATKRKQIETLAAKGSTLTTGADGYTNKANDLALGLYLVVETAAPAEVVSPADPFIVSIPILETAADGSQSWKYDVLAQPKNDTDNKQPSPKKTVTDTVTEKVNDNTTRNTASIGDVLTYTLSTNIINNFGTLAKLGFTDTMSKGLTLVNQKGADIADLNDVSKDVFVVEGLAKDAIEYTTITDNVRFKAVKNTDDNTTKLTITFENPDENIKGTYTNIKVSYKARINKDAVVGGDGNKNEAELEYGNKDTAAQEIGSVKVYTYGFTLQKKDENDAALAGATFKLYDAATGGNEVGFYTAIDENNNVKGKKVSEVITYDPSETATDEEKAMKGQASFYGLAAGTYYLEETKAPAGYNLLKERVAVTVSADTTANGVDITIVNTKGFTLPTTGGMGTVIFTIGGIVIMLGAALMLIRANKKSKAN